MGRPKPGHEPEFEAIFRALELEPDAPDREAWLKRFQAISDPPYAVLGAPRVGVDAAADEWLRKHVPSDFEQAKEKLSGMHVLDLLPASDGFPKYTNYRPGAEGYERYTFNAQLLHEAVDVIGEELIQEAYVNRLASGLAKYADALEEKLRAKPGTDPKVADILDATIRWSRYWSSRGHGVEPWF